MGLTAQELSNLSGVPGITLPRQGRYEFPADTPTAGRIKATVALFDCHAKETEHTYFAIGNIVNEITSPVHGERTEFCRTHFGQNRGKLAMEFAWVARYWAWNQSVGWPWGIYKATAKAGRRAQEEYIRRWKAGNLTVRQAEEDMKQRKAAQGYDGKNSTWNVSQPESTKSIDIQYYVDSNRGYLTLNRTVGCFEVIKYKTDEEGNQEEKEIALLDRADFKCMASYYFTVATPVERREYEGMLSSAEHDEHKAA